MSKTIDERVVKMEFDNREFESNVKTSMNTLDKLKKSLNFDNVATGLNTLTNISNKMDLRNISRNLDDISGKFSAMGIVGKRVLENLTDSAMGFVNKGLNFAREKLVEGGKKRALDIEKARFSLQGILGDAAQVKEVMEQARESVNDTAYAFNEAANAAASLTASGVKSGEELERAMKAIAGTAATTNSEYERIAHVFTTVAGNGRLMGEQLNQLSSAGMNAAVTLSKYVNDVLQGNITDVSSSVRSSIDAIIATLDEADEAGDKVTVKGKKKLKLTVKNVSESGKNIAKSIQVTEADIRNAVSKSAVSFDLFSEAMSRAYGEHAKDANKTFTGSLANIGAKFAQIGEKFYAPLIEQEGPLVKFFNTIMDKLKEAKSYISPDDSNNPNNLATMFVELAKKVIATANDIVANLDLATFFDKFYNILTKVINQLKGFDKVNHTWEAFVTFGKSLWNVFKFLLTVVKPLGKAFKEMLPLNTERTLLDVAKRFEEFTKKLSLTQKESDNLKDTFKGAIAIFKLLGKAFVDLFNLASPGTSTLRKLIDVILEITGSIGRFLVNLDNMTKTSDSKFKKFGEGIAKVFSWISEKVGGAVGLIASSFAKLAGIEIKMPTIPPSVQTFIDTLNNIKTQAIDKLTKAFDAISKIKIKLPKIDGELTLSSIFKTLNSSVKQFIEQFKKNLGVEKFTIEGFFNGLTEAIGGGTLTLKGVIHGTFDVLKEFVTGTQDILTSLNFKAVINAIKLGALVAFVYRFHMTTLKLKAIGMAWEPITVSLKRTLGSIRGTLTAFSNKLKAESVKEIAESIVMIVGSLAALALIPADKLTKATGVLTVVIGEFTAMLAVIGKFMKPGGINIGGSFNTVDKISNNGFEGLAGPIMAFAGLLLTMIPVFTKLGKMDWDSINKGLLAIGTVAGSISFIFAAIGAGNKLGPTKNYKEMAGMMVVMAGMLTVIIGSLSKLKDTDAASILATMGGITAALSVLFAFFKSNGNSLAPVALANTPGQLMALAISISILADAMKKIVGIVGSSSPGATLASFGGIVTFIYMLSKATGGLGGTMGSAASLLSLGIALRLLVKPLKAIADLSLSNPWGLVGGIGALMLLIITLGAAGPALDAAAPGIYGIAAVLGGIAGVIASLGAMFAGIGLMVGMTLGGVAKILIAVKDLKDLLKETDVDDMRQMLFALADGIGEFVLRINKINLKGMMSIGPIADVISAMSNLTPAVKDLAALPADQVDTAFTALGNAMRSFGDAFRDDDFWMATDARSAIGIGVGKAIGNYGKAKGIALLMQNVGALSQLCTTVVGIHVHELETSLSIIQSCFYSFGRALENAPFWNPTGRGKGIDKLCDGATKLITTISSLIMGDGFNREKLSQFSQVMSEIKSGFLIFADVLKKAPFWNPTGRGAGISLLVSGIEKLVKGVKAMVDSEITGVVFQTRCEQIAKGLEVLAGAMNKIDRGSSAYSRGKGLSMIMRSIKAFAVGVKEFLELANNENYSTNYSTVMGQIGDTLKEFGEALDKSGFWSSHRAEGLKIIINGLPKLGKAITTMVADNKDHIGDFCEIMDQAGITLKDFGSAMKEAGFWNPEGKGKGIAQVISALSNLGDAIKKLVEIQETLRANEDNPQTIETYFATYKNLLIDLITIFKSADGKIGAQAERVKKIADALKVFANAAKELDKHIGASLTKRLRSFGEAMQSAGGKILNELGEAFTLKKGSKGSTFVSNVINFFKTVISKISNAFSSRGALYSKLKNVGTNICNGIATGIRSNSGYNKIRAAINDVINKALNNYSRRTRRTRSVTGNGVASAGAKVTQQFAEGMIANTSSVAQAAGTVGQEALDSLRKAIIYISDMAAENMNLNPVITPVVDLSNVTESAKEISGLFGASNSFKMAGSNSAILAASRSLALANQAASMDNSDIVRAIYGLQTDFKDMSAKLTNLQVVMDSGALVGQISRPLDAALGVRYSRNRREKG